MVQGFALNDERFLKSKKSDQEYFKRLLERIKLIHKRENVLSKLLIYLLNVLLIMIKIVISQ